MKSYLSLKPGATFFLGSSRTLVYHKDDVEIIYRHKMDGKKYRRDSNQSRPKPIVTPPFIDIKPTLVWS